MSLGDGWAGQGERKSLGMVIVFRCGHKQYVQNTISAMVALTKAMYEDGTKVFDKLHGFESSGDSRHQIKLMMNLEDASEVWKPNNLI